MGLSGGLHVCMPVMISVLRVVSSLQCFKTMRLVFGSLPYMTSIVTEGGAWRPLEMPLDKWFQPDMRSNDLLLKFFVSGGRHSHLGAAVC